AFSALSDPTRRAILERLGRGPATISELAHPFGISLPGLLHAVRSPPPRPPPPALLNPLPILEQAHLATPEKHGRPRQCRLGSEDLDEVAQWIQTYRSRWEGRLDRLAGGLLEAQGEND